MTTYSSKEMDDFNEVRIFVSEVISEMGLDAPSEDIIRTAVFDSYRTVAKTAKAIFDNMPEKRLSDNAAKIEQTAQRFLHS